MINIYKNSLPQKEWDEFVMSNSGGTMAHLYNWREVIEKSYGHRSYYFHGEDSEGVAFVLPTVSLSNKIFGKQLVSMPFLDYGGVCVRDDLEKSQIIDQVFSEIISLANELQTQRIDLRHVFELECGWHVHLDKVTMIMRLAENEDSMWKQLSSERRNRIRKSKKSNLKTSFYGPDKIDDFYNVFAVNMRDLGSPVHSKEFFINILNVFSDNTKIILVKIDDLPIGAALCFIYKDTIAIPWVSSLRSHFNLYPNNLLYWHAMRYASNNGLKTFDFGRSSKGSGTYMFKKRWGAQAEQLFWHSYGDGNSQDSENDYNKILKYKIAMKIWKKIPVSITKIIGPSIRKNISR